MSSEGTVAVGALSGSIGQVAARWTVLEALTSLGDLPGGSVDAALGVCSSDGRVGAGFGNMGKRHAVRWTEAQGLIDLGLHIPADGWSLAWGISADGWVIVGESDPPGPQNTTAFIWNPVDGMRALQDVLEQEYGLSLPGWTLYEAHAISDNGRFIAGRAGSTATGTVGFLVELPPFCYADCDRSSGKGVLDLFDFLCFINKFNSNDPYGNCDNDGAFDLFDFLCFINHFNAGCP
jgi:uncharacterized membrane protein